MSRLTDLETMSNAVNEIAGRVEGQIRAEKIRLVQESYPCFNERRLAFSHYECALSPTGCCVYDDSIDPAHDDCIYCGEPEDRG